MSSSGSSEENSLADVINPYMRELKMHLKELSLKDGKIQIEDIQGPKEEGSLEARMEELEQEVFRYKKMAEREVDIIRRISQELIAKHKKETAELWDDILSLHETTNKLQAQLYDLQNQKCEYEARFKQMSAAASFRILETKSSFLDGNLCLGSLMMIKIHHHHRRTNSSLVLASPWLVPSLGECRDITSLPFIHLLFM
jgi:hypothetical protein